MSVQTRTMTYARMNCPKIGTSNALFGTFPFSQIPCKIVAALLHYLFLTMFFLNLCEGLDIFISIVIVFPIKSVLTWLLVMAYGKCVTGVSSLQLSEKITFCACVVVTVCNKITLFACAVINIQLKYYFLFCVIVRIM